MREGKQHRKSSVAAKLAGMTALRCDLSPFASQSSICESCWSNNSRLCAIQITVLHLVSTRPAISINDTAMTQSGSSATFNLEQCSADWGRPTEPCLFSACLRRFLAKTNYSSSVKSPSVVPQATDASKSPASPPQESEPNIKDWTSVDFIIVSISRTILSHNLGRFTVENPETRYDSVDLP